MALGGGGEGSRQGLEITTTTFLEGSSVDARSRTGADGRAPSAGPVPNSAELNSPSNPGCCGAGPGTHRRGLALYNPMTVEEKATSKVRIDP
jgi:hypothetical protein